MAPHTRDHLSDDPDPPSMACRTCGSPLNRFLDATTGEVRHMHPRRLSAADHDPDPAVMDAVDAQHVCDFCSDDRVVYIARTAPISTITDGSSLLVTRYGTDWSACFPCAGFLQARDVDGLNRRLRQVVPALGAAAAEAMRTFHQAIAGSMEPGLTLATTGQWPSTVLPAATLPKIRDRLAALLGGPVGLPLGLNPAPVRAAVADSVSTARLFWIDADFTDLADLAAASLPATTIDPADLPAPHGLLAWARPVGPRKDLIAASWTADPGGVRIIGYRSIGTGLPPNELQQLRAQIGWLSPRIHLDVSGVDPVTGDSPAAALLATWLMIAQRISGTRPVTVDRTLRRAYHRAGRAVPDVDLVHIRGAAPSGHRSAHAADGDRSPSEREHRWWVKAHWRQQAYGPGRALRRPMLVLPQLRGPDDKPIKASTVVRMLSAAPPRPPRTPGRADT